MLHVVAVEVRRFYKCYVEDEAGEMTEEQAEEKARQMIAEDVESALTEDIELEMESGDVLNLHYDYPVYD